MRPYPSRVGENAVGACLVANRDLSSGARVEKFEGCVVSYADLPEREIRHALRVDTDRWLLTTSAARFLNHSCDANCRVEEDLRVITTRAVTTGYELTICYNEIHTEERDLYMSRPDLYPWDPRWTFICRCGTDVCQGVIAGYVLAEDRGLPPRRPVGPTGYPLSRGA